MKIWLKKHGATSSEIPVYVSHLRELLNCENKESYRTKIMELSPNWSIAFLDYFNTTIDSEVYFVIIHVFH